MTTRPLSRRPHGFSLVEVMVALIVMSVGLLGIAKMQAVALSNTAVASTRSMAAIEASSLAASMHANRGYWSSTAVPATITLQGAVAPPVAPDCVAAFCTPANLAAFDLQEWTKAAAQVLPPDYVATITCTPLDTPQNCKIAIQWNEKSVALNTNGKDQAGDTNIALNVPKYELYVEP
jgi:type IV pilus assembly protein PilV